jgi:carbonic anhydrase
MPVDRILKGLSQFQRDVYPKQRELFVRLALGQRPQALFITCADSRIDPCLLTQTNPGDLFICRVIGNIVPPFPDAIGGVSATIEYAVGVLGVPDVIICGHTDCGVMKSVVNPEAVAGLPSVSAWIDYAQPARVAAGTDDILTITEYNVLQQIENLRTHPAVIHRLADGDLGLHGWVYHIGAGAVHAWDSAAERFLPPPAPAAGR